jgi:single-stranded-DNA-specific exonuclease
MISVSGKTWIQQKVNKNLVEKFKQDYNFNEHLSQLIVSRNFDESEINDLIYKLKITNNFVKNPDFDVATDILINSINKNEKICILGDYDVDGTAATSLLVNYFNYIKQEHYFYIPHREIDGYGATKKLLKKLIIKKPKLIIMVDCGSTSNEAVDFLNQNNINSIIIDHHEINKPYPKSNVIINPKKNNGYQKFDYFCATTLTYFFLDLLLKKKKSNFKLSSFLIYVLLATVCDVMPIRKVNKIIARNVIDNFNIKDNDALNCIFKILSINRKLSIDDLGFIIGPIINAGGRLGKSHYGTELFTSKNMTIINKRSIDLIKLNEKRKKIEKNILDQIDFKKINEKNKDVIIYHYKNLHEGLIGIIAARLKDFFNKPTIVITNSGDKFKGSARSTLNYNIGKIINLLVEKKILEKGGGHNLAAGFTIKKDNIKMLDDFLQNHYAKQKVNSKKLFNYDLQISLSAINNNFINDIDKLGPFGHYNPEPLYLIKNIKILKSKIINEKHIASIIKPRIGTSIKSICFNSTDTEFERYLLSFNKEMNLITKIKKNIFNNKTHLQLSILDIII